MVDLFPTLRLGSKGPPVEEWRSVLAADGYTLSGQRDLFETTTHNATVAWQKHRPPLVPDGIVGPATRAAIGRSPSPLVVPAFNPDAIPFVEAQHWQRDAGPQSKSLIVLHCMEYPETATSAEWCADFFAGRRGMTAPKASAHYCVDADSIVCCVRDDMIAWHAPGANRYSIGIEHGGYARQTRLQWLDDYSLSMLHLSARLTAHLCREKRIPVRFLQAEQLRRGAPGITTHAEVTRAWPEKGSHWDPGPHFPINDYLAWVNEAMPLPAPRR
jgi:N-acetyl-anhydromuramyl-L-alanine amidase AmpD